MNTNKQLVLEKYEAICNSRLPGKGSAARAIVESAWDSDADAFVDPARLNATGYQIDDQFTMNTVKGIVMRHPATNEQLKALKS